MKIKLLITSLIATVLIGCGGSGGAGPDPVSFAPATFDGLTATMSNDATAPLTGTITVTDINEGEDTLVAITEQAMVYGTFTLNTDGSWTYSLDTDNDTVAGLVNAADTVEESIEVESADGTTADLKITISGVGEGSFTQAAKISDTITSDTGELRYVIPGDDFLQGKLTLSFLKNDNAVDDITGDSKNAYITLYNSTNSTSNGVAILDLLIGSDAFTIRDQSGITVATAFKPDTWQDIEITWSAADATSAATVTILIDGDTANALSYTASATAIGGVSAVAFRFADNSATVANASFYVDDVKLYSDTAGTTLAFEDNFDDDYSVGDSLDTDNDVSPYNSSTSEATVVLVNRSNVSTPSDNLFAKISDTIDGDTGELRYVISGDDLLQGKLTLSFLKDDNAVDDTTGSGKNAYITLYNSANSTSNGVAILDFFIGSDSFSIRDQDEITVVTAFIPDMWQDIEITWSAADATAAATVTILIDGDTGNALSYTASATAIGGVSAVAFRLGDDSATIADASFYVDDVKLYSDTAGTTSVFEDNFEDNYNLGDSLDTDNASSPYNSSTSEAVVAN